MKHRIACPVTRVATSTTLVAICAMSGYARVAVAAPEILVDATKVTGRVHPYLFGQNLEYEYGTFSGGEQNMHNAHGAHTGGIWAEMLRDRKFEEGDLNKDGVASAWEPEERLFQHWWDLKGGVAGKHRYYIDDQVFYGGGASQAIEVRDDQTSIAQVGLTFQKGHTYRFYVFLKLNGHGTASVDFEDINGTSYGHGDFSTLTADWAKYTTDFTAPAQTTRGRVRISVEGSGTFWIDSASLMPADNLRGMRRDVVEAMKPLRVPIIRYPGGSYADAYHWEDWVGPRDQRPERYDPIWNQWESNDMGFDEFMDLAHEIGSEAQITTDYIAGTPEEAAAWVEYANGSAQSSEGRRRVQNGHAESYGIKIWTVGNESQGFSPFTDIKDYAPRFMRYAAAMRRVDPSIKVMAAGAPPGPLKWNGDLFDLTNLDFFAASLYSAPPHTPNDPGPRPRDEYDTHIVNTDEFYRQVVGKPLEFAAKLDNVIRSAGPRLPKDRPTIAVTEFQAFYVSERNDPDYRLADALYLAGAYHELMRRADAIAIADLESLVNVQGIIEVSQTSLKLSPEYFACLLYRNHSGSQVLSTHTQSSVASFDAQLPVLDSQATLSEDGKTLYLAVINRSETEVLTPQIRINGWTPASGSIKLFELNGKSRDAANPFGSSQDVNISERSAAIQGSLFSVSLPAHSVTVIEVPGRKNGATGARTSQSTARD